MAQQRQSFLVATLATLFLLLSAPSTTAFQSIVATTISKSSSSTTQLHVDSQILMGGGIAVAGLAAGIGLVAFTEVQGERAKERGSGLSDTMATKITGQLMEDVEVSSVDDLGSLTSQLEKALKETGKTDAKEFQMTEEEKKRIADEADDGW